MVWLPVALIIILAVSPVVEDSERYDELKRQAMMLDEETDFAELRFVTAEQPDYDPFFPLSVEYRDTLVQVRDGQREQAVDTCRSLPTSFFVSIPIHKACATRMASLGETRIAILHRFLANGLLSSLEPDDSGVTTIINVEEEYDFAKWKGYRVIGHATRVPRTQGGQPLSSLKVVDKDGQEFWIDFRKHPAYDAFQRDMIRRELEKQDE